MKRAVKMEIRRIPEEAFCGCIEGWKNEWKSALDSEEITLKEKACDFDIPYFPVYKRPFFAQNFHFKNRGSLIHGSKSFSTSMYCSSVCRYAL